VFGVVFTGGMLATAGRPLLERSGVSLAALRGTEAPPPALIGSGDSFTCTVSSVTDGDTFRCQERDQSGAAIRVRLSGVAARESDGTCRRGHPCPSASAEAATSELSRLASSQALRCENVGKSYNRVAAFCQRSDGVDLSCAMVDSGTVLKWRKHWGAHSC
jgi:endonuclease YncB( thermonuclease family)